MTRKVLVLGDSHVNVFNAIKCKKIFLKYDFQVIEVLGATASGLDNPNSQTNAYEIFQKSLRENQYSAVIVMLGEVDTGFVIWYRYEKKELTLLESLEKTISTYTNFLKGINGKVIVISAPLPSIKDGQEWGEVANLRREIRATQLERTKLTIEFNSRIQKICNELNIKYLNLDRKVTGANGLLKKKFYSKIIGDHHYDSKEFQRLLERNIRNVL